MSSLFESSLESIDSLKRSVALALALLHPPAELTVSQWADKHAVLPRDTSPEPGQWRTDRAPYQREMMDVVTEPGIETVVYMIASQLGKTASFLNTIWYFCEHDPSPILLVMPSEANARDLSNERLATAIRDTPVLTPLFGSNKTRESGNTVMKKKFPGGILALAGANAPRGLASRSVRVLAMDEIDGYPDSAGKEGDPVTIADARTSNFWNRIKLFSSTPSIAGSSRIEKLEELSDRRRYFVPCPHCGEFQTLEFESLKWPSPRTGAGRHETAAACYVCVNGCEVLEVEKPDMLRKGEWRKTNPGGGDGKTAGFQLSQMYSPWVRWPELADAWLKAYKNPQLCKAFVNTRLGRTYKLAGETVDDNELMKRRVIYEAEVPAGASVLTCGIDVQADRIEGEIVGWGRDDQSWSVGYFIHRCNPAMAESWQEIDEILKARFYHASGARLHIAATFIDSGFHTKQVYDFVRSRQVRRVFACKGKPGSAVPLTRPRGSRTNKGRVELRLVGIDTAKESLYCNLKVEELGPGLCRFPLGYRNPQGVVVERVRPSPFVVYDKDYFEQLTAEELVSEMDGMTPVRHWKKKRERNEALDCRVYAMAAKDDLNIQNWDQLELNLQRRAAKEDRKVEKSGSTESIPAAPPPVVTEKAETDELPIIVASPKRGRKQTPAKSWAGSWDR